jgi:hypothetical protein
VKEGDMTSTQQAIARPAVFVALLAALAGCAGSPETESPEYSISGTVSGPAGVTVTLSGAATGQTTTDGAGHYAFAGLANGSYTVTPSLPGYVLGPANRPVTLAGGNATGADFGAAAAPVASLMYDDFSSGGLRGAKWDSRQMSAGIASQRAVLTHAASAVAPSASASTALFVLPPANQEVTRFQTEITVPSASATGDTEARTGIDLLFQPPADRLQSPFNYQNALYVRLVLARTATGFVAKRQVFACYNDQRDCAHSVGVGVYSGNWLLFPTVVAGTTYTISISVNTSTKVVSFAISGGVLSLNAAIDLSGVTVPFTPDLSASNFYSARLLAGARGTTGGGDGSVAAQFDNVYVGTAANGATASLFDDFDSGSTVDGSRWTSTSSGAQGSSALIASGALHVGLEQMDSPGAIGVNLADKSASALQADVTVTQHTASGGGRIGPRISQALYNDGSNGSGTAPDLNGPNSQVGDLHAVLSMTGTDVSYAVVRCETALCKDTSFVQPYTSLGTITLGTTHTLYLNWDAASRRVAFLLDGQGVAFDPVAAGYAYSGAPRWPMKRLSANAGAAAVADLFGSGSSGAVAATFDDVKTN